MNHDRAVCRFPQLTRLPQQCSRSYNEQCCVLDVRIKSVLKNIGRGERHFQASIGSWESGSGRSPVSSIVLSAMHNCLNCYITRSGRRSSHFNFEHIHRLFASEQTVKMTNQLLLKKPEKNQWKASDTGNPSLLGNLID